MNLITVIENIEMECQNNKTLAENFDKRLASMEAQTDALLAQAEIFVRELGNQKAAIQKARMAGGQEFTDRADALSALIGPAQAA